MTDFKIGEVVSWNCRLHKIAAMGSVILEDVNGDLTSPVQLSRIAKVSEPGAAKFVEARRERIQAKIDKLIAQRDELM
jgi:hypothetical protein